MLPPSARLDPHCLGKSRQLSGRICQWLCAEPSPNAPAHAVLTHLALAARQPGKSQAHRRHQSSH